MNCFCKYTKLGFLTIFEEKDLIVKIEFNKGTCLEYSELLSNVFSQIEEYLQGFRYEFNIPYKYSGTEFQEKVWAELAKIPYGETRSYKDIANLIGNPKSCRAVGAANNKNPLPIIIPCHRVIGLGGNLTGYAGGLHIKKQLLQLERVSKIH